MHGYKIKTFDIVISNVPTSLSAGAVDAALMINHIQYAIQKWFVT